MMALTFLKVSAYVTIAVTSLLNSPSALAASVLFCVISGPVRVAPGYRARRRVIVVGSVSVDSARPK